MQPQPQSPHVASVAIHASLAPALKNVWLTSSFWSVYLWTFLLRWTFFCFYVYFFPSSSGYVWVTNARTHISGSCLNHNEGPRLKIPNRRHWKPTNRRERTTRPCFQIRREKFVKRVPPRGSRRCRVSTIWLSSPSDDLSEAHRRGNYRGH